jgi:RimJ/RimL family protein N-acetyltransferase
VIEQPFMTTLRLLLRPFVLTDAPGVQTLAGDKAIASTTLNIPHPYENSVAEKWIASQAKNFAAGSSVTFAVSHRKDKMLMGAISLEISRKHRHAEMGYWIGKPYWNQGYCTESAMALLQYGFDILDLQRIFAHHLTRNPASGRVMQKIGMVHEGCLRKHVLKWNVFEDLEVYGLLQREWKSLPDIIENMWYE